MMMAQKPLMLKDFLELDCDSDSSGAGFQCSPRRADDGAHSMRCLLNAELHAGGDPRLPRTRSVSVLKRISSVLNAVKLLPFADSPPSGSRILSRSFSRRMGASFWRKRAKSMTAEVVEEDDLGTFDDVRKSCDLPSLAVSRCSSWTESEFSSWTRSVSTADATSDDTPCAAGDSCKEGRKAEGGEVSDDASGEKKLKTAEREGKESPECHSASEEEKEQLSPVSVMDFPSEEEEEEEDDDDKARGHACNSFRHSLAKLDRRKLLLLHRIGRFESLTGLDPVDLDRRFATCDDDDRCSESTHRRSASSDEEVDDDEQESANSARKAWGLLRHLTAACRVDALEESVEKLLVDFFIHGLSLSCAGDDGESWQRPAGAKEEEAEEEALLRRAKDWVQDLADDYRWEETQREMDGEGWRRCWSEAAEVEVAVDLEGLLMRSLVAELVVDLVASR